MRKLFKSLAISVVLFVGGIGAHAFSLLGPITAWQIPSLNYLSPYTSISLSGDEGGPMNLGEEYRWGSPVLVYGFDSTFVEYFGPAGVAAVEAAMKILNELPDVTQMSADLREFPQNTTRFNYTAQQLRLLDIKSIALSIMLQNLGLATPERYAWTIRNQYPIPNTDPQAYEYMIIQRNFDPITWKPSSYVNGSLFTYRISQFFADPDVWDAQELTVDVANPNVSVIATAGLQAGVTDPRVQQQVYGVSSITLGGFGLFYTGLTRDDVGAIRYMYRSGNTNWQSAPLGSTGSSASSPWNIVGFQIINPNPGSPWTVVGGPFFNNTNNVGGVITGDWQDTGGRGGSGKVSYVRVDTDPLLGQYLVPVVISYPETVINQFGVSVRQVTQRTITTPDILFTAADLDVYTTTAQAPVYAISGFTYIQTPLPTAGPVQDGPGIINPGAQVIFNKVGPWIFNTDFSNTQTGGSSGFVWGSYNGTTNAPIVFPVGSTLGDLESRLFRQ
jgi:hypothetical protein